MPCDRNYNERTCGQAPEICLRRIHLTQKCDGLEEERQRVTAWVFVSSAGLYSAGREHQAQKERK
jgi:hypothetical protein